MVARVAQAWLVSLVCGSCAQAEIYKWIDANGQTHYGERKSDAGAARTSELKVPKTPELPRTSTPSTDYLRAKSQFAEPFEPPRFKREPAPLSDGRDHGTNDSRCALARDVLSGAVRHTNGKPTDQYDRDVAKSDVKAFCNSR